MEYIEVRCDGGYQNSKYGDNTCKGNTCAACGGRGTRFVLKHDGVITEGHRRGCLCSQCAVTEDIHHVASTPDGRLKDIFTEPVVVDNIDGLWTQYGHLKFKPTNPSPNTIPDHHYEPRLSFIKVLLDAGVIVRGYWKDIDYSDIDTRVEPGLRGR